jgi:hypothetical protein
MHRQGRGYHGGHRIRRHPEITAACLLALLLNSSPSFFPSAIASGGQTDCARFQLVNAWKGTITFNFSASDSIIEEKEGFKGEYTASVERSMDGLLNLSTREGAGTSTVRWSGRNTVQMRLNDTSKLVETTTYGHNLQPYLMNPTDPSIAGKSEVREPAWDHEKYIKDDRYTATALGEVPLNTDSNETLRLEMHPDNRCTYTIYVNAAIETTLQGVHIRDYPRNDEDRTTSGTKRYTTELSFNVADIPLPTSGLELQGSKQLPNVEAGPTDSSFGFANTVANDPISTLSDIFEKNNRPSARATVSWTLEPAHVEELELVVEPEKYSEWEPQGPSNVPRGSSPEKTAGNSLAIHARLQARGGGDAPAPAKKIIFEMGEVSAEPGVVLNWPPRGQATTDPDLLFEERLNPDMRITYGSVQRAETLERAGASYMEANVVISAFDWGAHGKLKVTAELLDGRVITGFLRGAPGYTTILLPKRRSDSRIADHAKVRAGIATSRADDDDGEDDPVGDGFKGDGLTLYEEYRGFFENGKHVRGNPKKKDLFINDRIQGRSKRGIAMFSKGSGLVVHHELRDDELPNNRVINANHSRNAPHVVDQHALVLKTDQTTRGGGEARGGPGTPGDVTELRIDPDLGAGLRDRIFNREPYDKVVAHELGHAVNVFHHGDWDNWTNQTVWVNERQANGSYVLKEGGQPITVLKETGVNWVFPPGAGGTQTMTVYLGDSLGQHSGDDTCFMRYVVAKAYKSQSNPSVRYWVSSEPIGTTLCRTNSGTGINAPGRTPQPRYGDAQTGRGDCYHQVRVNDAGNAPER